jgi:perosamine synthetase
MVKRIRLGTVTVGEEERKFVNEVLDVGFLSPGQWTRAFEEVVAQTHGKKFGLALNSGQSAIMVALRASKRHRVAVPAITYISSIHAIIQAGLTPVLVDVEPTPEAPMQWDKISPSCNAILPCHLFGKANRFKHDGRFICEDACESIYAPGIGVGDAICLSFYPSHTITAGFGGMILTDDEDLYFRCWQLVNHGRADWDDYSTCHNLKERFTFSEVGYSLKFSDLNAAFGLAQHNKHTEIISKRRGNANFLIPSLAELKQLSLPDFHNHTFMMFPILCKDDSRNGLEKALNDANIETRRMMPITTQPIAKQLFGQDVEEKYPNAKYINEHGLYIGCHQDLTLQDLEKMAGTIWRFYNG